MGARVWLSSFLTLGLAMAACDKNASPAPSLKAGSSAPAAADNKPTQSPGSTAAVNTSSAANSAANGSAANGSAATTPTQPTPSTLTTAADSPMLRFSLDLHQQLIRAAPDDNLAYSPSSIASALAMTALGGVGATAHEITALLHEDRDLKRLAQSYEVRSRSWQEQSKGLTMQVANRLFAEANFPLVESYQQALKTAFGADVASVDFSKNPDKARDAINVWVESKTQKLITELMPRGSVQSSTRLVLVNAVYFKGLWATPFDVKASQSATFHAHKGSDVKVTMMHHMGKFRHAALLDRGYRVVELPYVGGQYVMLVIVPEAKTTLAKVEADLIKNGLDEALGALATASINLALPKFKLKPAQSTSLTPMLQALGMKTAFQPGQADFTGISPLGKELFVSDVVHKAFIQVDEEGTEAAAATGTGFYTTAMPVFIDITVDRPFAFIVYDAKNHVPHFVGRVLNPATAG